MTIYKNIKSIAKKKSIQSKELAEAFGVTENQMSNYLNGRTKITSDQVPLFARLLRVSISELYGEADAGKLLNANMCPDCNEKQKLIDRLSVKVGELTAELYELQKKYINAIEAENKKAN